MLEGFLGTTIIKANEEKMREEALKEWTLESARSHERDSVTCSYTTLIWRSRFKRILQYMYMGSCVTTTASRLVL